MWWVHGAEVVNEKFDAGRRAAVGDGVRAVPDTEETRLRHVAGVREDPVFTQRSPKNHGFRVTASSHLDFASHGASYRLQSCIILKSPTGVARAQHAAHLSACSTGPG